MNLWLNDSAQKADVDKLKQLALSIASGVLPNSNNTLQDCFLHQIGQCASTLCKIVAASAVSDKIQELQAKIDGMAEKSKALNAERQVLQECMRGLRSRGKAQAEPASQGESSFL